MTHTKDEWVNSVMEQAQVFASAWSLVGSRFDSGNGLENAEEEKKALRAMLTTPPAQPAPVQEMTNIQRHEQNVQKFLAAQPAIPDAITDNSESVEYRAGWNDCRELTIQMRSKP